MNKLSFYIVLLVFSTMWSCKSSRNTEIGDRERLPNKKTNEIVESLRENDLVCDWMSIKYEVEIKTNKIDDSFKLYARLKQDSVIWISATYYAVEIGRFLFTPDSVKYIDRRNNKFFVGGYEYISKTFMIEADFHTLQSLILGNGYAFVDNTDEKLRSSEDMGMYTLSLLSKGQLRRYERGEELPKDLGLVISLWVNPEDYRLARAEVLDVVEERRLTATYSEFENHCNTSFPRKTEFVAISPNEQATVNTSVIKLSTGKKVSVSFTIPDKYEPMVP